MIPISALSRKYFATLRCLRNTGATGHATREWSGGCPYTFAIAVPTAVYLPTLLDGDGRIWRRLGDFAEKILAELALVSVPFRPKSAEKSMVSADSYIH
jgi:hypothetical protein